MSDLEYWKEVLSEGASDCELTLTDEQLTKLADYASGAHENYGMAFYSPPASDRLNQIEREWKAKYLALKSEFNTYRGTAEGVVKRILNVHRDDNISIGGDGYIRKHDGRSDVIA
jgi:hypothetical protein